MKFGIVIGEFHKEMARTMLESAKKVIVEKGYEVDEVIWVPGSYEAPIAMQHIIKRKDIDACVLLGYIERGETMHGEVMGHAVHHAMVDLMLEHNKPIGIGIIGPGATKEQADKRAEKYAAAAAEAAVTMVKRLRK